MHDSITTTREDFRQDCLQVTREYMARRGCEPQDCYDTPDGIDVICEDGETADIILVAVNAVIDPACDMPPIDTSRERIRWARRTAMGFLAGYPEVDSCRVDLVTVAGSPESRSARLRHLVGAASASMDGE